jgi:prepilin-type N-terminal cleavage/methylation domain-containing protein
MARRMHAFIAEISRSRYMNRKLTAFTLIELLIVVAIIAILAAIAVPNFLEAQTRSKVSRAKADMRSLATAIEAYRVDTNHYPPCADEDGNTIYAPTSSDPEVFETRVSSCLTTPIAYITALLREPFPGQEHAENPQFHYGLRAYHFAREGGDMTEWNAYETTLLGASSQAIEYFLLSHGPDNKHNSPDLSEAPEGPSLYDPTNGTTSFGDVIYWGPGMGYRN